MKKSFGDYQYLAGNTGTRGSLWEGADHLLYIESSGFILPTKETYKRVDYAKIQTLNLGRTRSYFWIAFWLLVLLALCVWGGMVASGTSPGGTAVFAALSAVLLLVLVLHLVKGPTCVCKLQTSVQVLRLKPLSRLRTARRCVARITELCQQFQGQPRSLEFQTEVPTLAAGTRPHGVKPPFTGSAWLRWALPLLLLSGMLTIGEPFVTQVSFFFTDFLFALTAGLLVIIGLAVNHRYEMPGVLRGALWGAVVNFLVASVLGYLFMVFATMQEARDMTVGSGASINVRVGTLYGNLFIWMARAGFNEIGRFAWAFIVIGGLNVFFALLGLPSALLPRAQAVVSGPPVAEQPGATVIQAATIEPQRPEEP